MTPFTFTRHNRSPRTVAILVCIYAALAGLVIMFGAALWIIAILALGTIPALLDVIRDTSAGMTLGSSTLTWHTGNRSGDIALAEIDYFRFDTRWDFSVRVSAVLKSGKRIRLPDETIPPHLELERLLQYAGHRVERHHFRVF